MEHSRNYFSKVEFNMIVSENPCVAPTVNTGT